MPLWLIVLYLQVIKCVFQIGVFFYLYIDISPAIHNNKLTIFWFSEFRNKYIFRIIFQSLQKPRLLKDCVLLRRYFWYSQLKISMSLLKGQNSWGMHSPFFRTQPGAQMQVACRMHNKGQNLGLGFSQVLGHKFLQVEYCSKGPHWMQGSRGNDVFTGAAIRSLLSKINNE